MGIFDGLAYFLSGSSTAGGKGKKKSVAQVKHDHVAFSNSCANSTLRKELSQEIYLDALSCWEAKNSRIKNVIENAQKDAQLYGGEFVLEPDVKVLLDTFRRKYAERQRRETALVEEAKQNRDTQEKSEQDRKAHEEQLRIAREEQAARTQQLNALLLPDNNSFDQFCNHETADTIQHEKIKTVCIEWLENHGFYDTSLRFGNDDQTIIIITRYERAEYGFLCNVYESNFLGDTVQTALQSIVQSIYHMLHRECDTADNALKGMLEDKGFYSVLLTQSGDTVLRGFAYRDGIRYGFKLYTESGFEITEVYTDFDEESNDEIDIDNMDGLSFEAFCADILAKNGFCDIEVTRGSGDQGIDIIAYKDDIKYGIQCKCYSSDIGNKAVQEVFAGKTYYGCHVGVVLTNRYFTKSARELAQRNGVILWDREKLLSMVRKEN